MIILDEGHNVEKMCEESCSVEISSTDIALCIEAVTDVRFTNNFDYIRSLNCSKVVKLVSFVVNISTIIIKVTKNIFF